MTTNISYKITIVISHYTRRCIITIFISQYIREYIMTTNISLIHEMYFSLYKKLYN